MKKLNGKIILVDDEKYEKDILELALRKRQWNADIIYFSNARDAFEYLKHTRDKIFIIISDMEMPGMSGLDFKRRIDRDRKISKKSIPFIFVSSSAIKQQVIEAYDYRLQGYFKKPISIDEQAEMLDLIIKYWIISMHPNRDQ